MLSDDLKTLSILKNLIAFPTISSESNLELIQWIEDYVTAYGATVRRTYNADKTKGNILITIGPADIPGVMLSGHTDVVPVAGQDWSSDPFSLTEKNGCVFGRGTCDMKGFIAVALAYVPKFAAANLAKPLHIALSYDEELGCIGVPSLIEDMANMPSRPEMIIVGEPTMMGPICAHKGKLDVRVQVKGLECHSSLCTTGVNAVEYAAEVISFIKTLARDKVKSGPFDTLFDVAHTTLHTGVIHGGTALNIVPQDCSFAFEIRSLPGDDPQAIFSKIQDYAQTKLEPEMKAIHPDCGFTWEVLSDIPGLDTDPEDQIVHTISQMSGANSCSKVAFGTEAGLFQHRWNIPTLICGPGDIIQAHKPDEFIALNQLRLCEAFIARLLDRITAS